MIFQLVYSSKATQPFWPDDLFLLVEKSRRKNEMRDITGMLLFHEGNFLQLLEGPERAVLSCFKLVQSDPRHTSVQVLLTQTREQRDFPDWTMGFEKVDEAWSLPRAWATILEEGITVKTASLAHDFLLSFHNVAKQYAAQGGSRP